MNVTRKIPLGPNGPSSPAPKQTKSAHGERVSLKRLRRDIWEDNYRDPATGKKMDMDFFVDRAINRKLRTLEAEEQRRREVLTKMSSGSANQAKSALGTERAPQAFQGDAPKVTMSKEKVTELEAQHQKRIEERLARRFKERWNSPETAALLERHIEIRLKNEVGMQKLIANLPEGPRLHKYVKSEIESFIGEKEPHERIKESSFIDKLREFTTVMIDRGHMRPKDTDYLRKRLQRDWDSAHESDREPRRQRSWFLLELAPQLGAFTKDSSPLDSIKEKTAQKFSGYMDSIKPQLEKERLSAQRASLGYISENQNFGGWGGRR